MKNRKVSIEIIALFILSCILYSFESPQSLTPSEERGKLIYTKGVRASGIPIEAQLSGATFDAKILPCVNCHGSRGDGNPEGGVVPSPLDWPSLTKPYSVAFDNGRKRTGYNLESMKNAVAEGIDPSNNKLDLVMPRYALNEDDISDLISYLKVIKKENLEGVSDSAIHIGVILSQEDNENLRAEAITKTISAYLDLVNRAGGVYNRKFELSQFILNESIEETDSLLNSVLEKDEIFAFIASDIEVLSPKSISILERNDIPIIGAISGDPQKRGYLHNSFYYLFGGMDQEIQALADFAKDNLQAIEDDMVILCDTSTFDREIDLKDKKIRIEYIEEVESEMLDQLKDLKKGGIEHCLFLGDAQSSYSLLEALLEVDWHPNLLLPGKFASVSWLDSPLAMNDKIYLSYPVWMADRKKAALEQYDLLGNHYELIDGYKNAQFNGLASTILFIETLKLTGKEVNRESMLETLHGIQDYDSGFVAPLSFGPNKRIGTEHITIVKADFIDKKLHKVN